jgi:hypothetical protein
MNSCEKATLICNKFQYREATFIEILQLKLHHLICKTCAKHAKKNRKLTSLCQKATLKSLSLEEKEKMKETLGHRS